MKKYNHTGPAAEPTRRSAGFPAGSDPPFPISAPASRIPEGQNVHLRKGGMDRHGIRFRRADQQFIGD